MRLGSASLLMFFAFACGDDAPQGDAATDTGADARACVPRSPTSGSCAPDPGDYTPCTSDTWDDCISDFGEYVPFEPTISTIARVQAYERIAALLFDPRGAPSSDAFLEARMIYQEDEGLDSRVVRRFDPHYAVPVGTDCTQSGTPAAFSEYCIGPSTLSPLILDALNRGIAGDSQSQAAGEAKAGLLWFLYVSAYKESSTCTEKKKDCDSAFAYYSGGQPREGGLALAAEIRSLDPAAHDRAWDGLLAVRCWRDLDAGDVATNLENRDRARAQYDRALLDGLAAVVRESVGETGDPAPAVAAFNHALATTLGRALLREAEVRDSEAATALAREFGRAPGALDGDAITNALDALFVCP